MSWHRVPVKFQDCLVTALHAFFLLAAAGAVPFLGKFAKGAKLAATVSARAARDPVGTAQSVRKSIDAQAARRKMLSMKDSGVKDAVPVSAKSLFEADSWEKYDSATQQAFEGAFRDAKRHRSETMLRDLIERADLDPPIEARRQIRYDVEVNPGSV